MEPTIDVIIPTYKPDEKFLKLIAMLRKQTCPIRQIIIMNTEEKYYEAFLCGRKDALDFSNVSIYHLSKREFDHGNTRHKGVQKSDADYFVCMTQDAIPADENVIRSLLFAFSQNEDGKGEIAVSYARQLPHEGAGPITCFTRQFNYPETPMVKGKDNIPSLGIKTYFCSNVCAMYKRAIYDTLGGFIRHTIFNEDMIYAAGAVKAGYRIAYAADAKVLHSHDYGAMEEFHRNFDLGVSQADHPEVFADVPSEGEGIRLVKQTMAHLKEIHRGDLIFSLIWVSGWKYLGYKLGKAYRKLPMRLVKKISMNRNYWK